MNQTLRKLQVKNEPFNVNKCKMYIFRHRGDNMMGKVENNFYINITKVEDMEHLYDALSNNLNFNKIIELYRLMKYKMEHLEDAPKICSVSCRVED